MIGIHILGKLKTKGRWHWQLFIYAYTISRQQQFFVNLLAIFWSRPLLGILPGSVVFHKESVRKLLLVVDYSLSPMFFLRSFRYTAYYRHGYCPDGDKPNRPHPLSSFDPYARWQTVTQGARSRWSYEKIQDCGQSLLVETNSTLGMLRSSPGTALSYSLRAAEQGMVFRVLSLNMVCTSTVSVLGFFFFSGRYLWEFLVGVCRLILQILTRFQPPKM